MKTARIYCYTNNKKSETVTQQFISLSAVYFFSKTCVGTMTNACNIFILSSSVIRSEVSHGLPKSKYKKKILQSRWIKHLKKNTVSDKHFATSVKVTLAFVEQLCFINVQLSCHLSGLMWFQQEHWLTSKTDLTVSTWETHCYDDEIIDVAVTVSLLLHDEAMVVTSDVAYSMRQLF